MEGSSRVGVQGQGRGSLRRGKENKVVREVRVEKDLVRVNRVKALDQDISRLWLPTSV